MNQLSIYNYIKPLSCLEIKVEFMPSNEIRVDGWIGAHIRNRLLYCAESIFLENGESLREQIIHFSLSKEHHWYKELQGGFPKAYSIKVDNPQALKSNYTLYINKPLCFSVILIGKMMQYASEMVKAIALFAEQGLKNTPFTSKIVSIKSQSISNLLLLSTDRTELNMSFKTPISLYKTEKSNPQDSFQAKMNGFPSLYQIVLSAANRIVKMAVLYGDCEWSEYVDKAIKEVANYSIKPQLHSCSLSRQILQSAPRRLTNDRMSFEGLVGEITWRGDLKLIAPLLLFCSYISLGDNTSYGMGHFEIID